jgi:hypothetical protein
VDFLYSSKIEPFRPLTPRAPYAMTNKGLEIETVLLVTSHGVGGTAFMPLNCARSGENLPIAVPLVKFRDGTYIRRYDGIEWSTEQQLRGSSHYASHRILILHDHPGNSVAHEFKDQGNSCGCMESLQNAMAKYAFG